MQIERLICYGVKYDPKEIQKYLVRAIATSDRHPSRTASRRRKASKNRPYPNPSPAQILAKEAEEYQCLEADSC
jgi:hypothetical protein